MNSNTGLSSTRLWILSFVDEESTSSSDILSVDTFATLSFDLEIVTDDADEGANARVGA